VNQYVLAGIAGIVLAAGAFTAGWRVNGWRHDAQDLHDEQLAAKVGAATSKAAVDAIGKIEIKRVTIRQELEREIRTEPAPPAVCDISDRMFDTLNQAITGQEPGGAGVPAADAAARPGP
jgi:hypothetical protein